MRNSFGTENPIGTPPDGLWASLKYHLLERDNLNFAVANFDRGAPFLNFAMLRFVEVRRAVLAIGSFQPFPLPYSLQ